MPFTSTIQHSFEQTLVFTLLAFPHSFTRILFNICHSLVIFKCLDLFYHSIFVRRRQQTCCFYILYNESWYQFLYIFNYYYYYYYYYAATGGMGKECLRYHSRLAELIAIKKEKQYAKTNSRNKQFFGILKDYQVTLKILPGGVARGQWR